MARLAEYVALESSSQRATATGQKRWKRKSGLAKSDLDKPPRNQLAVGPTPFAGPKGEGHCGSLSGRGMTGRFGSPGGILQSQVPRDLGIRFNGATPLWPCPVRVLESV